MCLICSFLPIEVMNLLIYKFIIIEVLLNFIKPWNYDIEHALARATKS